MEFTFDTFSTELQYLKLEQKLYSHLEFEDDNSSFLRELLMQLLEFRESNRNRPKYLDSFIDLVKRLSNRV